MFQGNGFQSNGFQIGSIMSAVGAVVTEVLTLFRRIRRR